MSLGRAFFQAGAHGVVASLWPLRDDESAVPPGIWLPNYHPNNAMGYVFIYAGLIRNYTARGNAIATFELTEDINSTTTVGGEFREDRFQRYDAGGYNMLPGTHGLGSLSERFGVDELDRTSRTVSGIFSQQLAWQDRIFVTGALRGDRNSNFGQQFGFQWYPSFSGSWVIGEESWFPRNDIVSSLRLRSAWGRSGLMPEFLSRPIHPHESREVGGVGVRSRHWAAERPPRSRGGVLQQGVDGRAGEPASRAVARVERDADGEPGEGLEHRLGGDAERPDPIPGRGDLGRHAELLDQ